MVERIEGRGWGGLPQYSKDMYKERYFLPNEDYEGWAERVAKAYSDDEPHKERIKTYLYNYWFHPATPVSSNAGVPERGLPISCYTNEVPDSKDGIFSIFEENNWLGSFGGGIGTGWSDVRELGAKVGKQGGKSGGIIPFYKVQDSSTLAVSQGGLRRASQAVYLDVSHPEIMEHIDIRRPTGDPDRTCLNLHHGVVLPNSFMEAVERRDTWDLISPKTGEVVDTVDAFDLFKKILITRVETGEPYMLFIDNVNMQNPEEYVHQGYKVKTSNLCSEIMLHTSEDKTGVCCLSSLNLEYYDEWENDDLFIADIHRFVDNVLQSFIELTEGLKGFEKARASAIEERAIGIGVMGYHSYLQRNNLPYSSLSTRYKTNLIFSNIKNKLSQSNLALGDEKGTAPISTWKRNVHTMAIAPTASISTLCNLTSPGIDPRVSNVYTAKSNIGSYTLKNKYLANIINKYAVEHFSPREATEWVAMQWDDILKHDGSVQHLLWMTKEDKEVFLTAYEINPMAYTTNIAEMTPQVSQGISANLFLPADIHVKLLYDVHMDAWKKGLKSLYYVRSKAISRASTEKINRIALEEDTCSNCA